MSRNGANALDVLVRIAADFELKAAIAFRPVSRHAPGHQFRRLLRHCPIQAEIVAVASAAQHAHRLPCRLAKNVPAGHVDAGFDIRVALERGIHAAIQFRQVGWVVAKKMRTDFGDAARHRVGGRKGTERTSPGGNPRIGFDRHHRAIKTETDLPTTCSRPRARAGPRGSANARIFCCVSSGRAGCLQGRYHRQIHLDRIADATRRTSTRDQCRRITLDRHVGPSGVSERRCSRKRCCKGNVGFAGEPPLIERWLESESSGRIVHRLFCSHCEGVG